MDWNHAIERHREALQNIVAWLVALAALADCAASRSGRVRRLVLSILRPAEVVARDFVMREAQASGAAMLDLPVSIRDADSVGDAMRLASCFRALALALACLLATATRQARRRAHGGLLLSDSPRPQTAGATHLHARRGLGFRALDSPHP